MKIAPLESNTQKKNKKSKSNVSDEANQLYNESNCYRNRILAHKNIPHIPIIPITDSYGNDKDLNIRYFVMQRLGLSLENLLDTYNKLNEQDVFRCAIQMVFFTFIFIRLKL